MKGDLQVAGLTLEQIVKLFIELNKGGKICGDDDELHLGYVKFEVALGPMSGDEGDIYSSDAQEGDLGSSYSYSHRR